MVPVWNDAKTFENHAEHMRMFRQSHHSDLTVRFTPLKDMPATCVIHHQSKTRSARNSFRVRGGSSIVPIQEVRLSRNSQN